MNGDGSMDFLTSGSSIQTISNVYSFMIQFNNTIYQFFYTTYPHFQPPIKTSP